MTVKKTIGEILKEIEDLKKGRDKEVNSYLAYLSEGRESHAKQALEMCVDYTERINYYSSIEVEIDDEYDFTIYQ